MSRPATYLAKELDRLPDGEYVLFLIKRPRPEGWTAVVQLTTVVRKLEMER